eukprot:GHVU01018646.1.p1 GENE.GHVU01018646.1~~GHVU01018646.1.p1  ORF type:complete len:299 (-),score=25.56 GHVU01018646.1:1060-1956(-)
MLDALLRDWLIQGCHPLCTVDEPGFVEFVSMLDPNYPRPCRKTATRWILQHWNQRLEEVILWMEGLGSDLLASISADKWTSAASRGYLDINIHVIDSHWKLHCVCVAFVRVMHPHSADRLAVYILCALRRMGAKLPARLWTLTSDSENLMPATAASLQRLKGEEAEDEAEEEASPTGEAAVGLLSPEEDSSQLPIYFTPGQVWHVPCLAHIFHHGAKEGEAAMTVMADSLGMALSVYVCVRALSDACPSSGLHICPCVCAVWKLRGVRQPPGTAKKNLWLDGLTGAAPGDNMRADASS